MPDLIDNCKDIVKHDSRFAKIYLTEMSALLDVLKEGDSRLFDSARKIHARSLDKLEKARGFHAERQRRNQHGALVDCLQFSDKGQILIDNPEILERLGFDSKSTAKRAVRELESLRNNLAHAQDIVTHDWAQIARMTQRVEEIVRG